MVTAGRHLSGLWAEQSAIDDLALETLHGEAEAGFLRTLDVSRCVDVTSAGLGELFERAQLRELRLVETPCDLSTLKRIPATQRALVRLDLGAAPGASPIDDELVVALARLPQLEFLSLRRRSGWTDAGLAALAEAASLRELHVSKSAGITAQGLSELRQARPRLVVTVDEDG